MADIFISYARKDEAFGRKLHGRLTGLKRDVWMDWEDIPFNSDWWQEIRRGIETSDNFLIILTNDFVSSPVCMLEVDYARQHNKRILVVAHNFAESDDTAELLRQRAGESETMRLLLGERDIVGMSRENWTSIGHVNWQFFNDDGTFEKDFRNLIETIDTDLNHVRSHTNLQVRALDWYTNQKNWSFLLTGVQIDQAEEWLYIADIEEKVPVPTHIQRQFIEASRDQQTEQEKNIAEMQTRAKRFRQVSIVAGIIAAIMIVVGIGASITSTILARNANDAIARANAQAQEAGGTLTAIPPTFTAIHIEIESNNTRVAAVGETLTPIGATLAVAEQARAEAQSLADDAQTQVANANSALDEANAALTPVAITLTRSADEQATAFAQVATANVDSMTAEAQVMVASTQVAGAEVQIADANAALNEANATLSPIAPTLTQASNQIAVANAASTESAAQLASATVQIADAFTQVADVNIRIEDANAVLTQIVPTLTQANVQVIDASTQVADASTQVANVDNQIATADTRNQYLEGTASAIQLVADRNQIQAQSQSLIVNAEQAAVNGDIDLALALLLESYEINPNLPQTRRLINDIAYTSARFILPDATFATFSSDSSMVAYGIANEVVILDVVSREEITRLSAHSELVVAGEFNFDGDLFVSGSSDATVIVWNTRTWEIVRTLSEHTSPIRDVTFDNAGNLIGAVADNDVAIVWNTRNGYQASIFDFQNPDTHLTKMDFYANGTRFLAWGLTGTSEVIYRVNMTSSQPPVRLLEPIFTSLNPAYDVNAGDFVRWAMVNSETRLTVYDLINPSTILSFNTGFNWIQGEDSAGVRAFNSTGGNVIVSLSNEREGRNYLVLFNTGQRERSSGFEFEGEATNRVTALAYSPDGRTILSGYGRYLVLWDVETGRELRRFGAHLDDIVEISYSLDSNRAITRSRDGNYRVWDVAYTDPAVIGQITVPNSSGAPAANPGLSPDGSQVYFSIASDIYRFSIVSERPIQTTFSYFGLQDIFYSRFNSYAVTTSADTPNVDPNALMWDMSLAAPRLWNEDVGVPAGQSIDPIGAFSMDARQIAFSTTNFIRVYDVTTTFSPDLTHQFDRRGMEIGALIFSPDGRYLYAAINQLDGEEAYALMRWDLITEEVEIVPVPHIRPITAMDINAVGTQIITASVDQTVVLFDLENKMILRRMIGHRGAVNAVYFGQNDEVALSASDDGTLILWDLVTGQSIRHYVTGNPISGLYLSNDNTMAVSTDGSDSVTIWQIERLDDVINWVRANRAIPALTAEQCIQYEIDCEAD